MKKGTLALALAALLISGGAQAETACVKDKAVTWLIDVSGSMMQTPAESLKEKGESAEGACDSTKKITLVKQLMNQIHEQVKAETHPLGIYVMAPYVALLPYGQHDGEAIKEGIAQIPEDREVMGRRSPLGIGLEQHGEQLSQANMKGTVIVVTDGEVNRGRAVISTDEPKREADESDGTKAALTAFREKNPEVCLSVISLAETQEEKDRVAALASYNGCSIQAELKDLIKEDQKRDEFIQATFYRSCETPAKLETFSIRGINFAFNSYRIDAKSDAALKDALETINKAPYKDKPIQIVGWTDAIGSDAYNKTLSKNRAEAVKRWLVEHGVDARRITTKGAGKSFLYDNKTAEGRSLNRRMDFVFE